MPDPIARKRLKKKMLDRWENEGGRIATDTTTEDSSGPTNEGKRTEGKGKGKKLTSQRDNSIVTPAPSTKRPKPTQK